MALGLIVNSGRVLTAKLLMGHDVEGISHCAIGDGDATFTDPLIRLIRISRRPPSRTNAPESAGTSALF